MNYKAYFIDLDGTLYRGKERIKEAEDFIKRLQARRIPFLFVTNNATRTPQEVADHIRNLCQLEIPVAQVYTSGLAMVDYLRLHYPQAQVQVLGEAAIKSQLLQAGYSLVEKGGQVVVQSLDRSLTYDSLRDATLAIRGGAAFLSTNPDLNLPSELGLVPGSGAIASFLASASGQEPIFMGKPHRPIMEGALDHLNQVYPDLKPRRKTS